MGAESGWFELIGKFVWPIFIVVLLLVFRTQSSDVYSIIKNRIESGSALKVGLFEIGEQAGKTEISALVFPDLPVEAVGGPAEAVMKESGAALERLQEELKISPYRRVDTLMVDSGIYYSPSLLKDYINTLGVRFIVFRENRTFDGWIEAGLFLNQLISTLNMPEEQLREVTIPYEELKRDIVGISNKSVQAKDSARTVLQVMQKGHTENLPVLDGEKFKFFANRGEILSNLISNFILKEREGAEKSESSASGG